MGRLILWNKWLFIQAYCMIRVYCQHLLCLTPDLNDGPSQENNSDYATFTVQVQAYGCNQVQMKYRKSCVSFKNGLRTAAAYAVGNKGKLRGRPNSPRKPGISPHDVMDLNKYQASMRAQEAEGLPSLTVIRIDLRLTTQHDPTVGEWRLGGKKKKGCKYI